MFVNDSVGDRQAQTGSAPGILGREEGIINFREIFRRYAHSGILDLQLYSGILCPTRDPQPSAVRHGVLRIQENIQEDLL